MGRRYDIIVANVLKANGWPIKSIAKRLEISESMVLELLESDEVEIDKAPDRF
jgi:ribosome-binding protein aMBF1 (putative translation factor)